MQIFQPLYRDYTVDKRVIDMVEGIFKKLGFHYQDYDDDELDYENGSEDYDEAPFNDDDLDDDRLAPDDINYYVD
jgi:hypothetical protein